VTLDKSVGVTAPAAAAALVTHVRVTEGSNMTWERVFLIVFFSLLNYWLGYRAGRKSRE
jgi:hypothetical protein